MTWPEALRWLAVIGGGAVSVAASFAALAWTLGRFFRPWMQKEARAASDELYERLKSNDFKHVEDRIANGFRAVDQRLDNIGGRLDRVGGRLDRMGGRLDGMEERMRREMAAMESRTREEMAAMEARTREAAEAMEARIVAAVAAR